MKKLLTGIIIVVVLFVGIWFFFLRAKSTPADQAGISTSTNPFLFGQGGKPVTTTPGKPSTSTTANNQNPQGDGKNYLPLLRQIWNKPVAGGIVFDDKTSTKMHFIDRSTGNVYEATKNLPNIVRLSNTTIPRIYETMWSQDGSRVLMRYLRDDNETIRTFAALVPTTTDGTIDGFFFPDDIQSPAVFKDKVAYLTQSVDGSTVITANLDGTKKTAIFSSPANEWMISWTNPNLLSLWSAPGATAPGVIYTLDATKGVYSRVASSVYGGEGKLNKDGSLMLVTAPSGSTIGTAVINVKTGNKTILNIATLADKCAWSPISTSTVYCAVPNTVPKATYPDDWYQGKISFSDSMWRVEVNTNSSQEIFNPVTTEGQSDMDIVDISINNKADTLLFKNKKDQTLWSYDIYDLF